MEQGSEGRAAPGSRGQPACSINTSPCLSLSFPPSAASGHPDSNWGRSLCIGWGQAGVRLREERWAGTWIWNLKCGEQGMETSQCWMWGCLWGLECLGPDGRRGQSAGNCSGMCDSEPHRVRGGGEVPVWAPDRVSALPAASGTGSELPWQPHPPDKRAGHSGHFPQPGTDSPLEREQQGGVGTQTEDGRDPGQRQRRQVDRKVIQCQPTPRPHPLPHAPPLLLVKA